MKKPHILVVDDEKEITDLIEIYLVQEGYEVEKRYNALTLLEDIKWYTSLKNDKRMLPYSCHYCFCQNI